MRRIPTVVIAIAASTVLMLSACGKPPSSAEGASVGQTFEEVVELAEQEGTLTLYTSTAESQVETFTKAFTDEYGVDIEVLRLSVSQLEQRFASEADSGNVVADVLSVSSPQIYATNAEWFADMATVENYDAYPESAKAHEAVTTMLYPYVLTYNTDLVAKDEVPKSWEEAVSDEWAGKVILTDPRSSPAYMGWADAMHKAFGDDFLSALGKQNPALVDSATPGAQQLAAGEGKLSFPSLPVHPQPLIDSGAPLAYVSFDDPPVLFAQSLGVSANAPHPNAARLFAAWSMSQSGAEAFCTGGLIASPLALGKKGTECLPLPEDWELVNSAVETKQQDTILDLLRIED